MNNYKDLDEKEKEQLMKFPAYISLLAAAATGGLDKQEKKSVIKLTHIKTFSSDPILIDFYKEVEKGFESTITILNEELPHDKASRKTAIEKELNKLETILQKLSPEYSRSLHRSLKSYKNYISAAHHNVLEYFIFPIPIKGLND